MPKYKTSIQFVFNHKPTTLFKANPLAIWLMNMVVYLLKYILALSNRNKEIRNVFNSNYAGIINACPKLWAIIKLHKLFHYPLYIFEHQKLKICFCLKRKNMNIIVETVVQALLQ